MILCGQLLVCLSPVCFRLSSSSSSLGFENTGMSLLLSSCEEWMLYITVKSSQGHNEKGKNNDC